MAFALFEIQIFINYQTSTTKVPSFIFISFLLKSDVYRNNRQK